MPFSIRLVPQIGKCIPCISARFQACDKEMDKVSRRLFTKKRRSSLVLCIISTAIFLLAIQQIHTAQRLGSDLPVVASDKLPSQIDSQGVGWKQGRRDHSLRIPPTRNDNNSTFSACLLVADDNHYLIEWLAFHYQTLPLRYLVIASDPRARTLPDLVLNRWSQHNNMTIVQWKDEDFLPQHWLNRVPAEDDPVAKLMKHRERQRHFYPECFQFLKDAGRQWVMVIDVDEVALQNRHYMNISNLYPTLLSAIQNQYPSNTTCITMPRLRFGNYEDGNATGKKLTPTGFQDRDFLTYRFRWRAGLHSRSDNKLPKSMIHVGRIANFSRQDTDAHRPVRSECPRRNLYTRNVDSPFSVHHYVGSQEQFRFRKDARDGTKTRSDQQLNNYNRIKENYDESATGWLSSFVQDLGPKTAKELLEGVGNISFTPIDSPHR